MKVCMVKVHKRNAGSMYTLYQHGIWWISVECDIAQDVKDGLEMFACLKCCPKGVQITSIPGTCSVNNLQKATGFHLHLVYTKSMYVCQVEYDAKLLPCINGLLSHYNLATIRTQAANCCHSQHWFFQNHRLLERVSVKLTAPC